MEPRLAKEVRDICLEVLSGTTDLEDLYNLWPEEASQDPFLLVIFEDLEEGVEHIPGRLARREVNLRMWRASSWYSTIYLDWLLLAERWSNRDTGQLLQCREWVDQMVGPSHPLEIIEARVEQFFLRTNS